MHELYRLVSEYVLGGRSTFELFTDVPSLQVNEHTVSGPLMSHEAVFMGVVAYNIDA